MLSIIKVVRKLLEKINSNILYKIIKSNIYFVSLSFIRAKKFLVLNLVFYFFKGSKKVAYFYSIFSNYVKRNSLPKFSALSFRVFNN